MKRLRDSLLFSAALSWIGISACWGGTPKSTLANSARFLYPKPRRLLGSGTLF